jgi:hypothetical protein
MIHVQCNSCGAWGVTDNHAFPDHAAVCTSPADDPPGSPDGSCCPDHETLDHHLAEAQRTGVSHCRPVTLTIMGVPAAPGDSGLQFIGTPQPPIGGQN